MATNFTQNKKILFATGCFIGLCVFLFVFTFSTLNVTNDSFFINGFIEKDVAQHYAGWLLFSESDWQFPLGVGENMAYPYGSSVSYTDSVPLFAIFFKLFASVLPETFQYFGIYVCLCYMLMGGFSALLIQFFANSFIYSAVGALLFSFSPVMMERAFRHTALTSHFLIIAALYYYFKNKGNYTLKSTVPFIIINVLAITIHPYFLPFTFGISFAFYLEWAFAKKQPLKASMFIIISLGATLFTGWVIGAFHSIGSAGDIGYGTYSLNLNSYINPVSKNIGDWSVFTNPRALLVGYQEEAFNYLGFGVIVALVLCIPFILIVKAVRKEFFTLIKSSFGIIVTTVLLTIFALSNLIAFGGLVLINVPLSPQIQAIASVFRASGRFGWLLFYLIYLIVAVTLSRVKIAKIKFLPIILLSCVIVVNIYDISPVIAVKNNYFSGKGYAGDGHTMSTALTDEFWHTAVQDFDYIAALDTDLAVYAGAIDLAVLSGKANRDIKVNLSFEARAENENRANFVQNTKTELQSGMIDDNTLYLVSDTSSYTQYIESEKYIVVKVDGQLLMFKNKDYDNK